MSYEDDQDCAADNGDAVNARCTSGICRSSDNKCGCTVDDHCPSNEVCKRSTNTCVTQQYKLSANCDFNWDGEGTNSRVSLKVKRGSTVVNSASVDSMDKPGGCPSHTFNVTGAEPDEYEIRIHGGDKLGVSYFKLEDITNGGEIRRWRPSWGTVEGWCFSNNGRDDCWDVVVSGAGFPILGVKLYKNGSDTRIKFSGGSRCRGNQSCSSGSCKVGGGRCGPTKMCCTPVSSLSFLSILKHIILANLLLY